MIVSFIRNYFVWKDSQFWVSVGLGKGRDFVFRWEKTILGDTFRKALAQKADALKFPNLEFLQKCFHFRLDSKLNRIS